MEEICAEQADAWLDKMRIIKKLAVIRSAAWEVRRAELEVRRNQVLDIFDSRAEAAQKLTNAVDGVAKGDAARASPAETPKQ